MGKSRYRRYTICGPSGDVYSLTVPKEWSGFDVQAKHRHSLVFMHVPKGYTVISGRGEYSTICNGPAVVLVNQDAGVLVEVPRAPSTDAEAFALWREYVEHDQRMARAVSDGRV